MPEKNDLFRKSSEPVIRVEIHLSDVLTCFEAPRIGVWEFIPVKEKIL